MIPVGKAFSMMSFELRRSMSVGRMIAFFILAGFPPAMILLISLVSPNMPSDPGLHPYPLIILFLSFVVMMLALLLWATPNVYAELESRNWIYISNRPGGRISLLLGKWLASSIAALVVSLTSVTLCWMIVVTRFQLASVDELREVASIWGKTLGLWAIASANYAALFSLIGVLFQRRAMVIATIFTLGNEVLLAFVPALVAKFSIRYHLVGLMYSWFGWIFPVREPDRDVLNEWITGMPVWSNYLLVVAIPAVMLVVAGIVIRFRQYITIDEA